MPMVQAASYPVPQGTTIKPEATPQPFQTAAGATPEAFGAGIGEAQMGLGRAVEQASNVWAQQAVAMKDLTDRTVVAEQVNGWQEGVNSKVYTGPDALIGKKGRAWMDAYPGVLTDIENQTKQQRDSLAPGQRLMFDHEIRAHRNTLMRTLGVHHQEQVMTYALGEAEGGRSLAAQSIAEAAARNDDAALAHHTKELMDGSIKVSALNGESDLQRDARLAADRATVVKTWVTSRAVTDPVVAGQILDHNKDALTLTDYATLRSGIDEKINKQVGQVGAARNRPDSGGPVTPLSGPTTTRVSQAAKEGGVDENLALTTAHIESSMGKNLGKRNNIFQLGQTEWAGVGGGNMADPDTQIRNGIKFLANTKRDLTDKLGRDPTDAEVYLAHQQGVAGAVALLNNPDKPAGSVVSAVGGGPENISNNGGDPQAPASAFVDKWRNQYERTSQAYRGGAPRPAAPGAAAAAGPIEVWGDSLGVGLQRHLKGEGYAVGGATPTEIFDSIKKQPESYWQGKIIVLPSGSNHDQMGVVDDTIRYLQEKGARVIAVGYGPKFPEKNAALRQIGQRLNVPVIDAEGVGAAEGVHPSPQGYQSMSQKITAAAASLPAAAAGPTPSDQLKTPAGLTEKGNIDLNKRPQVKNADGSISTVRSLTLEEDDETVVIPSVAADGSRILSNEEATDQYHETGQHLGKFDTLENAQAYARQLHEAQAQQYVSPPAPEPKRTDYAAWVRNIEADGTMTREQKDLAIADVSRHQQAMAIGQEARHSDLERGVVAGTVTRAQIESDYNNELISPGHRTHLHGEFDKIDEQHRLQAEAMRRVDAAGKGGPPLDPKTKFDKDALDYHFSQMSQGWSNEERGQKSVDYAIQYGMVPKDLQAMIRSGLHSGDPNKAVWSANAVNQMRNANPQLLGEIGDENDLRLATSIWSYSSAGMPPGEAAKRATENLKLTKAIREAREEDFKTQRGRTKDDQDKSDRQWIEGKQNSLWVHDPDVPPEMRREFHDIAQNEFINTGNLDAARQLALDTVNRVWGRSRVGGDLQYMKLAPEKFFGVPALTPAENGRWMNEQLLADVSKGAFADPTNPITADRIRILPSHEMGRDGFPRYQVWLMSPTGLHQVIDGKGEPITWFPRWGESAEAKRRQEENQAKIERSRNPRLLTPSGAAAGGAGAGVPF